MEAQRPNPDGLLSLLQQDRSITGRGRLKIFFGASAGVGKTYSMLSEAQRNYKEGKDVMIGVVETHGRKETAALCEGIPVLPPKEILHRGVKLFEFNLEEALERKPGLILVDEFAHTNAPGTRHPKRWQDVEELLNHGIDVYTTLNVQHLDSINDQVTQLTGVQVRETVPDRIFDEAHDVALIDIPSDELLKRLQEGKVYNAEGANKRAAEGFFKKTNLVALRELALRRTADRVDAENDVLNAALGHKEAPVGQKILVCVGHDSHSAKIIRHAKRMAARAKASWYAAYVETGRHERLTEKARLKADRNLRLAEKMGAKIVRLSGSNAAEEITNYARDNGFTRIVVGHKSRVKGTRWLNGSLSMELLELGACPEITTVTDVGQDENGYTSLWARIISSPSGYFYAVLALSVCTLAGLPFRHIIDPDDLTMVYLTCVVIVAACQGTGPAIFTSFASVLAFNYFFTKPYNVFHFYDPGYSFTFITMLLAGLFVGSLAAKLSLQARQARRREQENESVYALTKELSSVRGIDSMAEAAIKHVRHAFGAEAAVFAVTPSGGLTLYPDNSPARELKEESVARWALLNNSVAGHNTDTLPSARGLYVPLAAENETLGVLGLIPAKGDHEFTGGEISRLETFATIIASAFQRANRAEEAERAKVDSESEKLRNALLSSVSHDLRTPLASITGAAAAALTIRGNTPKEVNDALTSIHTQASRLAKLVTNLLDAASLEAGAVKLNRQPYHIQEIITSALARVQEVKGNRFLTADIAPGLPLFSMDGLLVEQVLVNLLDNSIRYTRHDGAVMIEANMEEDSLRVCVRDNGVGLPPGEEEAIFDKFHSRGHHTEGGAGLGLTVCRGVISAHGGSIFAENNKEGGACFTFTLPGPDERAGTLSPSGFFGLR